MSRTRHHRDEQRPRREGVRARDRRELQREWAPKRGRRRRQVWRVAAKMQRYWCRNGGPMPLRVLLKAARQRISEGRGFKAPQPVRIVHVERIVIEGTIG